MSFRVVGISRQRTGIEDFKIAGGFATKEQAEREIRKEFRGVADSFKIEEEKSFDEPRPSRLLTPASQLERQEERKRARDPKIQAERQRKLEKSLTIAEINKEIRTADEARKQELREQRQVVSSVPASKFSQEELDREFTRRQTAKQQTSIAQKQPQFSATGGFTPAQANFSSITGEKVVIPPPRVRQRPVISAAGPDLAQRTREARRKERLQKIQKSFVSGVMGEQEVSPSIKAGGPEAIVATTGLVVGIGGRGKAAKVGKQVLRKAAPVVQKVKAGAARARDTQAARFLKDLGVSTVKGTAIVEGAKVTSQVTAEQKQKQAIQREGFRQAFGQAFQEESKALREESFFRGVAFEISPAFSSKKQVFEKTLREEFKKQGLQGLELETSVEAAKRQRKAVTFGEAGSLLEISRGVEKIGRREVTTALGKVKKTEIPKKKAGLELFKVTAPQVGKAGVIEGVSQEVAQQRAREQPFSAKEVGISAGLGGVSAGVIGGGIIGTKINLPKTSKTIELASFVTDPFEKPADIAQDITEIVTSKVTKKPRPRGPVITEIGDVGPRIKMGVGSPVKVQKRTPKPKASRTPVISLAPVTSIPTAPKIPIGKPTPKISVPTTPKVPTKTPVTTKTPPVNIPTFDVSTPVNVPVTTPVPVFAPISLPTRTPQLRVPPPLPLGFPRGALGAGTKKGKPLRFFNEVRASKRLFASLTTSSVFDAPKPRGKVKKKQQGFDFSKLVFG